MGDAEEPGAQGRRCLQGIQSHKGLGEGVLDDILAVDDRTGQASTIAVQFRPQVANQSEEFRLVDAGGWPFQAQATSSSSMVIPVSRLSANASAVALRSTTPRLPPVTTTLLSLRLIWFAPLLSETKTDEATKKSHGPPMSAGRAEIPGGSQLVYGPKPVTRPARSACRRYSHTDRPFKRRALQHDNPHSPFMQPHSVTSRLTSGPSQSFQASSIGAEAAAFGKLIY